ncbi:hypothetical protein M2165_002316 [Variovorax sp. TBS-050B]|uniref:DUF4019 domain-containing protein n=1 Tax=Variovorax sp. TBS-050B TaxID=2940551 RepID=UPI0024751C1B|nr:DUF4019 domain-containing protein [Variovorax sp. TBS-050B]MDH6592427.1 hypothetical protein [Variovorax sp. TBS-050B]
MNPLTRLLSIAAVFFAVAGPAAAQDVEPSDMVRGGMQAIQMIDQGKAGELWDGATAVARKRVSRSDFAASVTRNRASLGTPTQRTWVGVNRQVVTDPDPETAGQYVSVEYETRFSSQPAGIQRELVSFRLDNDRVWRFSGYVLRQPPAAK